MQRAVNRRIGGKGGPKRLEVIADKCAEEAMNGEGWAVKEIGDRLDGKPVQGVELAMDVRITAIERRIVDPEVIEVEAVAALEAPLMALAVPGEGEGPASGAVLHADLEAAKGRRPRRN